MRWRLSKRARQPRAAAVAEPAEAAGADLGSAAHAQTDGALPSSNGTPGTEGAAAALRDQLTQVDDVLGELRTRLAALDVQDRIMPMPDESAGVGGELPSLSATSLGGYTRPVPDAWLFREEVLLSAGPFADLLDVHALAKALTDLPSKPEVAVWGFDGNNAVIKLSAQEPLRLVDEDIRSLPFRPRVVLATPSALTLKLELPPVQRPRADEGPALPLHLSA